MKHWIAQQRKSLPIAIELCWWSFFFWCLVVLVEERLVEVRKNDILIIVGETGSGKTTPAKKSFSSAEGDHITLVNVYRASAECLEKSKAANSKDKTMGKNLNKWCRDNFINSRSLGHARDVHSQIKRHVQQMNFSISSCGDDMVQFLRCLTASFFPNAAQKQLDGSYRALASGQSVQIHPSSVFLSKRPDCIIFNELIRTNHNYV